MKVNEALLYHVNVLRPNTTGTRVNEGGTWIAARFAGESVALQALVRRSVGDLLVRPASRRALSATYAYYIDIFIL
jgi:hypothetical protein